MDEIDLTPEQDEALDRAWKKLEAQQKKAKAAEEGEGEDEQEQRPQPTRNRKK